ncbi:hypothetical protein DWB61_08025 [Ancylomarina euxinus]|uniref:ATP-grasp domain-containing protein n=2 Tax=Ancylomarina euxinus TaxID=2283627 RepID=A0A425Y2D3_9BACT|nr:hypothetical protein DWB61_08025 [Ancylomarina euxinus]
MAISNGTVSFMPNKVLTRFEQDLDLLPMYYAKPDDVILVHQLPDAQFLSFIESKGIQTPRFQLFPQALTDQAFLKEAKAGLQPWGWSPRMHYLLAPFKDQCQQSFLTQPNAYWQPKFKELYSREMALSCLQHFLQNNRSEHYISTDLIPQICTTISEVEALQNKWQQIVIKSPWSSSGRGLQILRKAFINKSVEQALGGVLKSQGFVMVEAFVDKQFDFSIQFYADGNGELDFKGFAFFETNDNGQYQSNLLGFIPHALKQFLNPIIQEELISGLKEALKAHNIPNDYCGHLGIDCMLFIDTKGIAKIQPCLEINLRYNMSVIASHLSQYLHPDAKGSYNIFAESKSVFINFNKRMIQEHPFEFKDGKWYKGYLPLTSPNQDKLFGAYVFLD